MINKDFSKKVSSTEFPKNLFELEHLFECEAKLIKPDIHWYYTGASFMLVRKSTKIVFYLNPSKRTAAIGIYVNKDKLINLSLEKINGVFIRREDYKNVGIIIEFEKESNYNTLFIDTYPTIKVEW